MTDIITRQEYKAFKNITTATDDAEIDVIIPAVSAFIERYCDRIFVDYAALPGIIEYFDGDTSAVMLTNIPVIDVEYVGVSTDGGVTYTELSENDPDKKGYFLDNQDREYAWVTTQKTGDKFITSYDTPLRSLKIQYLAGYWPPDEVPPDLKNAAYNLVEYYLKQQYVPAKVLAGATMDNAFEAGGADLPAHVRRILDLYRVGI
jgi:hypothetical protein